MEKFQDISKVKTDVRRLLVILVVIGFLQTSDSAQVKMIRRKVFFWKNPVF